MLCCLPSFKVWAHLSPFPWGQAQQEWGPNPCTHSLPHLGQQAAVQTPWVPSCGPRITFSGGKQAFLGEKGFSSRTALCSGLTVMAAAQEVSWSTPPRNLYSGNTLASWNNWEIYLQIPSNMRHHVKIRLKWLIWGNCRRNSPSLCHFFIILK